MRKRVSFEKLPSVGRTFCLDADCGRGNVDRGRRDRPLHILPLQFASRPCHYPGGMRDIRTGIVIQAKSLCLRLLFSYATRCHNPVRRHHSGRKRRLCSYHHAFSYFARRYGFYALGSIQPHVFPQPSAHDVAEGIDPLRELEPPVIFGSSSTPSPVMEQFSCGADVPIRMIVDPDLPGARGDPRAQLHRYDGRVDEDAGGYARRRSILNGRRRSRQSAGQRNEGVAENDLRRASLLKLVLAFLIPQKGGIEID